MTSVTIVIPTYNERDNIESILSAVRASAPEARVLVVDDGSPDGTGQLVDARAESDPHIAVLHREKKGGIGAAYRAGFARAIAEGAEVLVQMDADGSHDPADIPRLLSALSEADLVIGSRWIPGGRILNWPWYRQGISRGGSAYARAMLRSGVADMTAGFRAFRSPTLTSVGYAELTSTGYCFQIDTLRRTESLGFRIVEIPVTFLERERGSSKMSGAIVAEAMLRVTGWGIGEIVSGDGRRARRARKQNQHARNTAARTPAA